MSWTPLLNNEPFSFSKEDLPSLIHGEEHAGASLFSLTLFSELYRQGEPLLFLSNQIDDLEAFISLTDSQKDLLALTDTSQINGAEAKQVIYLAQEQEALLLPLQQTLPDWMERCVLIKNFQTFSTDTLSSFYTHVPTIFSGDLNTCPAKEDLLQLKYNAKIFFSPLHNDFRLTLPELEKYHGYFQGRISQGTVSLEESST